ncbi:MAG TPA: hypothetical protein VLH81_03635 [Desulfobacterales bacterium]|nr:hypothetical protein [Desulfobacterales bacterium]
MPASVASGNKPRVALEADRDAAAWTATMERLDREEAEAQAVDTPRPTVRQVAESLADLASLLSDAEPATQQRIVQALFEQVEVLGPNEVWLYPRVEAEARGWAAAMSGEFRIEIKNGRRERGGPATTDLPITMRLAEPPEPIDWLRSA